MVLGMPPAIPYLRRNRDAPKTGRRLQTSGHGLQLRAGLPGSKPESILSPLYGINAGTDSNRSDGRSCGVDRA